MTDAEQRGPHAVFVGHKRLLLVPGLSSERRSDFVNTTPASFLTIQISAIVWLQLTKNIHVQDKSPPSFQHNMTVQLNRCTLWPIRFPSSLILPSHHKTLCVCVLLRALKIRHLTGLLYSTFWSQTHTSSATLGFIDTMRAKRLGVLGGLKLSGGKRATRSNVLSLQTSCRRFSPELFYSKRWTQAQKEKLTHSNPDVVSQKRTK